MTVIVYSLIKFEMIHNFHFFKFYERLHAALQNDRLSFSGQ